MKIGILGCGRIAQKMGKTLEMMGLSASCYIASRNLKKAQDFQEQYHFGGAYGSYEEMLANQEIALVYIATVNSLHYEHAKMCLEMGKHVLLEKPMTLLKKEAEELFSIAKAHHVLLLDALWTAYMPSIERIHFYIEHYFSNITSIESVFKVRTIEKERVKRKDLGGGALYDLGIYPLFMIFSICGSNFSSMEVKELVMNEEGVDEKEIIDFHYPHFVARAIIDATFDRVSYCLVQNETYQLHISPIQCPTRIELYLGDKKIVEEDVSPRLTGFEYEIETGISLIENHLFENPYLKEETSLKLLEVMEKIIKLK